LDRNVGKGFTVGDAIAFLNGKADMRDYRDGDSLKVKTYQTTLYAMKDFGKWYVQGNLTGAIQKFESTRETVIAGTAKSEFDGKQLGVEIGTGIRLDVGRFTITPSASFNCARVWVESYKENGASALSLSVNSSKQTQARSALGGRITTSLKYNNYVFAPFANAYWQHDFTSQSSDLTASFVGGSDEFVTPGQSLNRDQLNAGIGIGVSKGNLYAQISYAAEVDKDNVSHAVQVGISMMF
jgi:outer membrane autotransporter protein